jgi:hypothetical protein
LHCGVLDEIKLQVVKRLTAILFSVALVWMQVAFAPVLASPVCVKPVMGNCADYCAGMACCETNPASNSRPAPAVPTQAGVQNQILLFAPAVVVWTLPENAAGLISSTALSPLLAMAAPLYARNCSLLL